MRVKLEPRRVTLRVIGPASEKGHIKLTEFIRQLEVVREALVQTDRNVAGAPQTYWRVVNLSHQSPATVVLEEVPTQEVGAVHIPVARTFAKNLALLSRRASIAASQRDMDTLESYRELGMVARRTANFQISVGRQKITIGDKFRANLEKVIGPDQLVRGSVMGALEAINLHGRPRFNIYPTVGAKRISCTFPEHLKQQIIGALDRYVRVSGTLKYKSWAPHAHAITVDELEAMPETSDLPKLSELRGIAPDATDGLSSEDFVRRQRDGDW